MWGGGERLFEFDWEEEVVGAYSRPFSAFRLGAYSNKYGTNPYISQRTSKRHHRKPHFTFFFHQNSQCGYLY